MPYEKFFAVTDEGDRFEQRSLPAAWRLLTRLGAGRVERESDLNEPGRVTVASRSAAGVWTTHKGAYGAPHED